MQYMLLIYLDEQGLERGRAGAVLRGVRPVRARAQRERTVSGRRAAASDLDRHQRAVRDGKRLVTDGPFAETREQLGGYFLIDAEDLDEAIDIAARIPAGRWGTVEIRPVVEVPSLPTDSNFAGVSILARRLVRLNRARRRNNMRFMMIVKASKDSEAGKMPSEELLAAMGKYNEELMKAGVLVDLSGLQPSSKGARVKFSGGKRTVIDGPFAETKELIGGLLDDPGEVEGGGDRMGQAAPAPHGEGEDGEIEIRQFFELEDFAPSEAVDRARELGRLGAIRKCRLTGRRKSSRQ